MVEKSHFDLIYGESLLPILQSLPTKAGKAKSSTTSAAAGAASSASGATAGGIRDKPIKSYTLNPQGAPRKGIIATNMAEGKSHQESEDPAS